MGDKFTNDKHKVNISEIFYKIDVFVKLSRLFMSKCIFITFYVPRCERTCAQNVQTQEGWQTNCRIERR